MHTVVSLRLGAIEPFLCMDGSLDGSFQRVDKMQWRCRRQVLVLATSGGVKRHARCWLSIKTTQATRLSGASPASHSPTSAWLHPSKRKVLCLSRRPVRKVSQRKHFGARGCYKAPPVLPSPATRRWLVAHPCPRFHGNEASGIAPQRRESGRSVTVQVSFLHPARVLP
jgi:hypothetical protein